MALPLGKRDLIKELFLKGKVVRSDLFTLRYSYDLVKRQDVSFVVPAKAVPKAVLRNRIKRRARAIVRSNKNHIKDTFSGVFVAKPNAKDATFDELERSIKDIMSQITK